MDLSLSLNKIKCLILSKINMLFIRWVFSSYFTTFFVLSPYLPGNSKFLNVLRDSKMPCKIVCFLTSYSSFLVSSSKGFRKNWMNVAFSFRINSSWVRPESAADWI